jgi:hypothetical protein
MRRLIAPFTVALALASVTNDAKAQAREDMAVNAADRERIIDGVAQKLVDGYVFADRAAVIHKQLNKKSVRARYDLLTSATALTEALTRDLQAWSHDRHLRVVFSVRPRPMQAAGAPTAEMRARELESAQARNFGFHQVERLTGNIGLLEIGRFEPAALAARTATAAFEFLAHTDALIIDLRNNGGGRADMVAFLTSHFLDEQTHLLTLERRDKAASDQVWSLSYVPGPRYVNKPVFVLTSSRTFSGAEGLTYDLRHFVKAVVVGEKTRGGANPGGFQMIDGHFAVAVPTARVVHAVTGTNWDSDGITPDVAAPYAEARKIAHRLALQTLLAGKPNRGRSAMWQEAMDELFPATTSQAK